MNHRQRTYSVKWMIGLAGWAVLAWPSWGGSCGDRLVETFEGGSNEAAWSFGGFDEIEPTGGADDGGAWLRVSNLATFYPILQNDAGVDSPFNGDFRSRGVTSVGLDAQTVFADFGGCGLAFSVVLRDTKGTANPADDDYAYFWDGGVEMLAPCVGEGWVRYDVPVPSADTSSLPAGWTGGWDNDPENFRPGVDWNDVITSVDRVEFWWGGPPIFAIVQEWEAGADNLTIECGGVFSDGFEEGGTGSWSATRP